MSNTARWVIVAVAVALLLGLLIWARGVHEHRGDDVGARAGSSSPVRR